MGPIVLPSPAAAVAAALAPSLDRIADATALDGESGLTLGEAW
jgi:hypothetical protein